MPFPSAYHSTARTIPQLVPFTSLCPPGSEMQYVLSYVEEVRRHGSIKWTMRQIGVYHRYSSAEDKCLWILLYNRPNSMAQKRLETMIENRSGFRHIHLIILWAYFKNWRWYLNTLSNNLETIIGKIFQI